MNRILSLILAAGILFLSSCGNSEMKKDARNIATAMCKSIEAMSKLKAANPDDSAEVSKLQAKQKQAEIEMQVLYQDFRTKYKDKITDEKFSKEFALELRKSMLDCQYLSKEDRANFEKEINK